MVTPVPPDSGDHGRSKWHVVHFSGGPWDAKTMEIERVVGPLFAVGHEIGNHYWLDTKSDPPTYVWDGHFGGCGEDNGDVHPANYNLAESHDFAPMFYLGVHSGPTDG